MSVVVPMACLFSETSSEDHPQNVVVHVDIDSTRVYDLYSAAPHQITSLRVVWLMIKVQFTFLNN